MKMIFGTALALLLLPVGALAQGGADSHALTPEQRQEMIKAAEEMRNCFDNVDREELKELQKKASAIGGTVKKLCDSGQRVQAQNEAILFSQEFANSPAVEQLRKCGKIGQSMIPDIPEFTNPDAYDNKNICDTLAGKGE